VPLVAGLVDALEAAGIAAFGPAAEAARIEGSKVHAKELMAAASVPTAAHAVLRSREEMLEHLACASYPAVLKADGLAAGKGVIIAATEAEAREAVDVFFVERRFGDTEVVLEEHLEGEELSVLALCDGENVVPLAPARDYKRIFDGDRGPNTGGMGSYSPVGGFDRARTEEIADAVHRPIVDLMRRRGTAYHGVLYAGLMITPGGLKVLEFNCRFGDPETQAILPRVEGDLGEALLGAAQGDLGEVELSVSSACAVTVALAAGTYPEGRDIGSSITGIAEAEALGAVVFHAGTAMRDGQLVTSGGRILNVTGLGDTLEQARARAYEACEVVSFEGARFRRDIAAKAVKVVG
jgi:phosphoribosylamine--glycine ligase